MVELLRDDLALQLMAFKMGLIRDLDRNSIGQLAARLEYPLDWNRETELREQAGELLDRVFTASHTVGAGKGSGIHATEREAVAGDLVRPVPSDGGIAEKQNAF